MDIKPMWSLLTCLALWKYWQFSLSLYLWFICEYSSPEALNKHGLAQHPQSVPLIAIRIVLDRLLISRRGLTTRCSLAMHGWPWILWGRCELKLKTPLIFFSSRPCPSALFSIPLSIFLLPSVGMRCYHSFRLRF